MRSTSPGRLSSSQDLSIGRSISFTRSSSVRAFCTEHGVRQRIERAVDRRARSRSRSARGRCRRARLAVAARAARRPARLLDDAQRRLGAVGRRSVNIDVGRAVDGAEGRRRAGVGGGRGAAIASVRSSTSAAGSALAAGGIERWRAWHRCRPGCWRRRGGGAAAAVGGGAGRARRRGRRRLGGRLGRLGRLAGVVVGNDAPDGGQDFLHRGLLDLRRLAHSCNSRPQLSQRLPVDTPEPASA